MSKAEELSNDHSTTESTESKDEQRYIAKIIGSVPENLSQNAIDSALKQISCSWETLRLDTVQVNE